MQVQSGSTTFWQPWREMFSHYSGTKQQKLYDFLSIQYSMVNYIVVNLRSYWHSLKKTIQSILSKSHAPTSRAFMNEYISSPHAEQKQNLFKNSKILNDQLSCVRRIVVKARQPRRGVLDVFLVVFIVAIRIQ